jgi:hypothetical protein
MSRFRIEHPTREGIHAEAGHDPVLSYYVDLMRGHRVLTSYDFFHPLFNRARPLLGCVGFLASAGFSTPTISKMRSPCSPTISTCRRGLCGWSR